MKVARYWARRSCTTDDENGYPVTRTVLRGSDISLADAEHQAKVACDQICQDIRAGFEPDWYEYDRQTKPEPIEREWFDQQGRRVAAVTTNRFGIPVLNTADLAIIDVDVHGQKDSVNEYSQPQDGLFSRLFGRGKSGGLEPVVENEEDYTARLRDWASESDLYSARIYRTAKGLRYILRAPQLSPSSDAAQALMVRLKADPLYANLCRQQESYRARLAPKPWRIGCRTVRRQSIDDDGNYREHPDFLQYLQESEGYAVCELVDEIGPPAADAQVAELIRVHDEACKIGSGLPLA